MDKKRIKAIITVNAHMAANMFDMRLSAPFIAETAVAGQFVTVYLNDGARLLPRPFGVCGADRRTGEIRIVYGVVGEGTRVLSRMREDDEIFVMGPIGVGFPTEGRERHIIIGGGAGIPPLLFLCQRLAKANAGNIDVFLGYRTVLTDGHRNGAFLANDFSEIGVVPKIATDDGSLGFKGDAPSLFVKEIEPASLRNARVYACGPNGMLKAVARLARKFDLDCFISVEERMACGLGACVGCVVKVKDKGEWTYKKVCSNGPVFSAEEVFFDE
ncbi:MAG: dihydroorotate dehydrogenase electron transfer subunit [Clostridiales bacterium]|jgi:dihydroorotate dehydrogenase electron transfer subunit|nr:dihydroorotate dehydrogenase electron transfer subunit [Clostridiales bacterium]